MQSENQVHQRKPSFESLISSTSLLIKILFFSDFHHPVPFD